MASTIVGIDIGSTSVRAVEVSGALKSKPVVTRFHEVPLPEGAARRGEVIEVSTVSTALRRLWSAGGFSSKDVALGMGGQRVFARDLTVPRASLEQIRESLPFHVQDLLPVPVSEALLDFYPIAAEAGDDGPAVRGLLVAAIKDAVNANVRAVIQAGLRPVHVDFIPFALSRALAPARTSSGISVLLGIGANTTNIVVVQGGVPQFVRIIAAGGDDITRALSTGLKIDPVRAEALKRGLGVGSISAAPEQRPALEIIYSAVGEMLNSIRNTLSYYTSTKRDVVIDRVVVSGGATQLAGFTAALSQALGLPVTAIGITDSAQIAGRVRSKTTAQQQDAMSTALGLALGTAS